jgi:glutaredoxin
MRVVVYTTEVCPKCRRLKNFLNASGIDYEVKDMQSPEGLTELRFNGVFALEAPVLQIGEEFFTSVQLFKGTVLQENYVISKMS